MRVFGIRWRALGVLFSGLVLCLSALPAMAATPAKSDVRVLIDISGSMRKNDPQNLRRPAMRMLAGLLQPGTRAGVWTFARWVNNLVPVAEVDAGWKKRTQSLSKQISSPGQFTNIEEVLDQASRDWKGEPVTHARHLVLLTDGMVDVSKRPGDNAQSRARIVDRLLPRLKKAGVRVHTIALSERADHQLMQQLAGETGGHYQQVAQADELQRVFLRMFETVGKPDAVPLEDNRFVVDASIDEATILLFSKADSPPPVLISPTGEEYADSDLPAGVAWYRDKGYDLITVSSPAKGEWRLRADVDPDNRVLIVTDLKLRTSEVPAHISVGEPARIEASLDNRGKLVTRQAFLRLLEVRAEAEADGEILPQRLNDLGEDADSKAADGRYTMRFSDRSPRDQVQLLVAVESPTFMRQKRFRLVVHEPVRAEVLETADGPLLQAMPQRAVLQPEAELSAWQEGPEGTPMAMALTESGAGVWQARVVRPGLPSFVRISGMSRLGNPIEYTQGPLMPPGMAPPAPPIPEPVPVVEPEPAVVRPPIEPAAPPVEEVPAAVEEESWVMAAALFGGFNLVLLIAALSWFLLRRRRAAAAGGDALDDLDDLIEQHNTAGSAGDAEQRREDAA